MLRVEKTVFISYRRTDAGWARAIFQHLKHEGYDVFFDYTGIASGSFADVILQNVKARAHFLALLTPTSLDRVHEPNDWVRQEIETAIEHRRNVVPLFIEGFQFNSPGVKSKLTGALARLTLYNGLSVPMEYFDAAMGRLEREFLNVPVDAVLHPLSSPAQEATAREVNAAVAEFDSERSLKVFGEFQRYVRATAAPAGDAKALAGGLGNTLELHRPDASQAIAGQRDVAPRGTVSISPISKDYGVTGGTGMVAVHAVDGQEWTAVSNHPFVRIESGASGRGTGLVTYTVQAGLASRRGTLTIADQTFVVRQNP